MLEDEVFRDREILFNEYTVKNHIATIDIASAAYWLFLEGRHAVTLEDHLAEPGGGMDGGNGDETLRAFVRGKNRGDVYVCHAVSVGEEESMVRGAKVFCRARHSSARHRVESRTDERDFPVRFRDGLMEGDRGIVSEGDGRIGHAQVVVCEEIDKCFALVSKTKDESAASKSRIDFHDMPQNGLLPDGHHRLGKQFRDLAEARSLAPAQNHYWRHLFFLHGNIIPYPSRRKYGIISPMKDWFSSYRGKRVLVTGHTGFKGAWLCEWLLALGADVHGFALPPPTHPSLFSQLKLAKRIKSHVIADIRDLDAVVGVMRNVKPDFVFHLAAQPLVRLSYAKPVETFDTNVMGTVHVLEAARRVFCTVTGKRTCSVVCVTTDKCYENKETSRPYKEDDPMGGYDPYSCSKGCDELLISSYRRSFFGTLDSPVWVASARAGNVIGGGDWAKDRIVPDCMRALAKGEPIPVRNKTSTRPWQHVLEPLGGYLTLGVALASRTRFEDYASGFNFGPDPRSNRSVKDLVCEILKWRKGSWEDRSDTHAVHEAELLNLDISKARRVLGWRPKWDFMETVRETALWYGVVADGMDPLMATQEQIREYCC